MFTTAGSVTLAEDYSRSHNRRSLEFALTLLATALAALPCLCGPSAPAKLNAAAELQPHGSGARSA
jgi:hypothetical protein